MEWRKITVALLVIGVFECAAMGASEIEEFRNFLKKTSHLEETLKKGPGFNQDDHGDAVSDHAWEDSGKFEGDIILNERQRKVIVQEVAEGLSRNGLLDTTKRWPDNEVIYYIQKEHFTSDHVQAIEDGINDLTQASCIKFRPYRKGDRDAVVIQGSRRGCFSQVGYQGGYQVLNLSGRHPVGRGCFRHGTVVHELLHTLGFYHMQSSPDRDDYIDVLWENIVEPAKHNFRKYNTFSVSDFGVGYDYDSVLHYSRGAFSRNGRDTLVPKQGGASIGQRVGLSDKDTRKLNKMYCDAGSDDSIVKDEQTTQKSVSKKTTTEPNHFEGHGLGYHQGKTVVIKLTPSAAKTYNIPDFPTFHMFDYFSKEPETLSPTVNEETDTGKQLNYSYESPDTDFVPLNKYQGNEDPYSDDNHKEDNSRFDEEDIEQNIKYDYGQPNKDEYPDKEESYNQNEKDFDNYNDKKPIEGQKKHEKQTNKDKQKETSEKPSSIPNSKENDDDGYSDFFNDYNEEFERLGKIIRDHVYPSQTPNFDIYKAKGRYEDKTDKKKPQHFNYESADKNENHDKESKKDDISSILATQDYNKFNLFSDKPRQFSQIHDIADRIKQDTKETVKNILKPENYDLGRQEAEDFDESSYHYKDKSDSSLEHLDDKDYTSLFNPDKKEKTDTILKGGHSIIGYAVPEFNHPKHKLLSDYNNEPENTGYNIEGIPRNKSKQAFKIIGLIVPLSDDLHRKQTKH